VNALANESVGGYISDHFVCAVVKVGTFTVANGQKQGGNVASYFCTADGSVLHAIAGPVNADMMLREARWVVETRRLAMFESHGNQGRYREVIRRAHGERLQSEYGVNMGQLYAAASRYSGGSFEQTHAGHWGHGTHGQSRAGTSDKQYKVHMLLFGYPQIKVEQVYRYVFEKILNEKVSTLPVVQR
jgi:hypothetical protein